MEYSNIKYPKKFLSLFGDLFLSMKIPLGKGEGYCLFLKSGSDLMPISRLMTTPNLMEWASYPCPSYTS